MQPNASTIYALATPPGRAGVAVIRISGANTTQAVAGLTTLPPPRVAALKTLKDGKNFLDRALCIYFPAPNSFSGEDVVELQLHGGRAVVKSVLDYLGRQQGLRLAEPGEFARRAFINGKLDLAEAEGLADLINAETESQHIQAIRQYSGQNSQRFEALRASVIYPLALLEAYIDFPDENIPESVLNDVTARIAVLREEIGQLLNDGAIGEQIRSGIDIVLIGAPNSGKSTLINALTKRDIAIVSPEAGTTRDLLEVPLDIGGYKVTLIDTAGIRDATHEVEKQGILRARNRARNSALKLLLIDVVADAESQKQALALMDENCLKIYTKCDLKNAPSPALQVSAKTGAGMDDLIAAIKSWLDDQFTRAPSPLITQARHRQFLASALAALEKFSVDTPIELQCEELRHAAASIAKITGKIAVDDLLDVIFASFCIGK
ncbi:MAG: tRNA uridine-5-carboxymethylaminomethyl(34) synthesis GTPase MnmE [Alphaproteobacteria bacterium]